MFLFRWGGLSSPLKSIFMDSDFLNRFSSIWSKLPKWAKIVLSTALGVAIAVLLLTSCGTTTRVVTRTSDSASVNISISAPSTNDTDVDVNPDIDFTITRYNNKRL